MLLFTRKVFDQEAWFYTDGDVRQGLPISALYNMMLPVPPIEEQRHIVEQYQTVERRIKNNERLIALLEDTAQTIFRHRFVENIDMNNLPSNLVKVTIGSVTECNTDNLTSGDTFDEIRYLDTSSVTENKFDSLCIISHDFPSRAKRKVRKNDILYSTVRPNLHHYGIIKDVTENTIVSTGFLVIRSCDKRVNNELIFLWLTKYKPFELYLQGIAENSKATYPSISAEDVLNLEIVIPKDYEDLSVFHGLYDYIYLLNKENSLLYESKDALINRL